MNETKGIKRTVVFLAVSMAAMLGLLCIGNYVSANYGEDHLLLISDTIKVSDENNISLNAEDYLDTEAMIERYGETQTQSIIKNTKVNKETDNMGLYLTITYNAYDDEYSSFLNKVYNNVEEKDIGLTFVCYDFDENTRTSSTLIKYGDLTYDELKLMAEVVTDIYDNGVNETYTFSNDDYTITECNEYNLATSIRKNTGYNFEVTLSDETIKLNLV